jgi:alkyl hydroperoxide reductase subunit AhpC
LKQFDEAGAKLLGLSIDTTFALKTWATAMGGIRHPLLSDFWPHGAVAQSLGIFNEDVGMAMRALFIIDPDGVVRHSEMHTRTLPDPAQALAALAKLTA